MKIFNDFKYIISALIVVVILISGAFYWKSEISNFLLKQGLLVEKSKKLDSVPDVPGLEVNMQEIYSEGLILGKNPNITRSNSYFSAEKDSKQISFTSVAYTNDNSFPEVLKLYKTLLELKKYSIQLDKEVIDETEIPKQRIYATKNSVGVSINIERIDSSKSRIYLLYEKK